MIHSLTKKIFDNGNFQVYKIFGDEGDVFVADLPPGDQSIFVLSHGGYDFYNGAELLYSFRAVDSEEYYGSNGSDNPEYETMRENEKKYSLKFFDGTVCYCISSNYKKNPNVISGGISKYKEGETVTFETDFILIGAGSAKSESNKYNEGSVVRKPKQITMLEDCVIASFNVTKKS